MQDSRNSPELQPLGLCDMFKPLDPSGRIGYRFLYYFRRMGEFRNCLLLFLLSAPGLCAQVNIQFMIKDAVCNDGHIQVIATGGTEPYWYEIIGNTCGLSNRSIQSSPVFSNLTPCTYTVWVLDGTGTATTKEVVVGGNYTAPTATVEVNDCGFTIHVKNGKPPLQYFLSTDGGFTYGPPSAQNTFSALSGGTYQVRVEDSCGYVILSKATIVLDTLKYHFDRVFRDKVTDSIAPASISGAEGPFRFYIVNGMDTLRSAYNTFALKDIVKTCSTKVVIESACGRYIHDFNYVDAELVCLDQTGGTAEIRVNAGTGPFTSIFYPAGSPEVVFQGLVLTGLPTNSPYYSFEVKDACGHYSYGSFGTLYRYRDDFSFKTAPTCELQDSLTLEITQNNYWKKQSFTVECTSCTPVQRFQQVEKAVSMNLSGSGKKTITIRDSCGSTWTCTSEYTIPVSEGCDSTRFQVVNAFACNNLSSGLSYSGDTLIMEMFYLRSESGLLIDSNAHGIFIHLVNGSYTVQARSAGCGLIERAYTRHTGPDIRIGADGPLEACAGDSILLRGMVTGGIGPMEFWWTNGSKTQNTWIKTTGLHQLMVRDSAGCLDSVSAEIRIGPALSVRFEKKDINCYGDSTGSLHINPSGGLSPYSFKWSNGNSDTIQSNLAAGIYKLSIIDRAGCTHNDSIELKENPPLALTRVSSHAYCAVSMDGYAQVNAFGGAGGYSYLWNTGDTGERISRLNPGSYLVTVTDQVFCKVEARVEVGQKELIRRQRVDTICAGSRLTVGSSEYRLSGDYQDTLKTLQGCDSLVFTRLTVNPPVSFDITAINPACQGQANGSIAVSGLNGKPPFQFQLNGKPIQGFTANQLPGGNYVIKITDGHGCFTEKGTSLANPQAIQFHAGTDSLLSFGDSIQLKAMTNLGKAEIKSIRWFAGPDVLCSDCETVTLIPRKDLTVRVELESWAGCIAEDKFTLRLNTAFRVFAPNILYLPSNAGVGANGKFTFYGPELERIEYLRIFDRYGSLVFEIKDAVPGDWSGGWDGNTGQKPVPSGVYVYLARVRFADESTRLLQGNLTVVR